ncbi:IclR family transcriptional regulator [Actinotalea sp. JY-7876]|uniref:IclR family transcriptional regulator n=1 Tax=Actinotalea sp. JY-7876 TaxID=2758442 RepID=UPI0015F6A757|nr:IclR family transcriptional regulator [Actinotalea sp. JY-7876]
MPADSARNDSLSLRRGLALLDAVREAAGPAHGISTNELAVRLGVHRSSVARLLAPLVDHRLLRRDASGRYHLGDGVLRLGQAYLAGLDLTSVAAPHLRALAARTEGTCLLVEPADVHVRRLDTVEAAPLVRMASRHADRLPMHCTASGKAVLSVAPAAWIDRVIATGLHAVTPRTITDPAELRAELARTRKRGFAIEDQEHEPEIRSVAAPVFNQVGDVVAAVSVATLVARMPPETLRATALAVIDTARALSAEMGAARGPATPRKA